MSTEEAIEADVQEVRCTVTGVPLPSIPAWYAGVQVKFISDAVRQRATRTGDLAAPPAAAVVEPPPRGAVLADDEEAADTTLLDADEVEADDVVDVVDVVDEADVDLDETEPLDADEVR